MKLAGAVLASAIAASTPAAAQVGSAGTVPGGITLVPGTVVTSQVGGTFVTGTVPLAGTIGSPGVPNFNPRPDTNPNSGALYPILPNVQIAPVLPNQSTLPQSLSGMPNPAGSVPAPPTLCVRTTGATC